MPELPDVELFREILAQHGRNQTIEQVAVSDPRILGELSPKTLSQHLIGKKLVAARRYGKHLFAKIAGDGWLTFHFGMTGGLEPYDDPQPAPAYDRVHFDFPHGHHLAYINRRMIGHVGWTADADAFIAAEKLGPDALDAHFTFDYFEAALRRSRRDVKTILMDQEVVAGIGNIYSDEILFQARLHPKIRSDNLDARQMHTLYEAIGTVLRTAIEHHVGAEQFADRMPQNFLLAQRKKGGHCPRCGTKLETLKSGGRTAYFCPHCQRLKSD